MMRIVTSGALVVGLCALGCASNSDRSAGGAGAAGAPSAGASSTGAPAAGASSSAAGASSAGAPGSAGSAAGGAGAGGATGLAGSGSAGSSGATTGGAAGNAGAAGSGTPGDSCAGLTGTKFCSNWDAQAAGKPLGDFSVNGDVTVDDSKAYSGAQSLHYAKLTKPAKGTPNINFTKQFPIASNDLHGRLMYFITTAPKNQSHFDFITSRNGGNTEWSIGGQGSIFELVVDPPDDGINSATKWPEGQWVCLQWEYDSPSDPTMTALDIKLDGVPVDKGVFTGKSPNGAIWKAGTWQNLKFGFEMFGNSDVDIEFWIDDLAWGEQPIACPAVK
jgi:hypothetical protein